MLTFQEVSELCQKHKIEMTIVTVRSYAAGPPWVFAVSAEYVETDSLRIRVQKQDLDLSEAINSTFAELFKLSREGFKFPVMLEAPKADLENADLPF